MVACGMDKASTKRESRRHLPPLQSLAAFDAAARLGSFTQAADELCVTQSAVSQRIRALEEFVQCPLFRRLTRRVELTAQGAQLAPRIAELLDGLQLACADLGRTPAKTQLTLSVVSSFASRWLVPRIGEFTRAHPHLELHLLTNSGFARTLPDEVDAAILWGRSADWPEFAVCEFVRADLFPVCSPALLKAPQPAPPADLIHHVLLRHRRRNYWPGWLALAGVGRLHFVYGPEFDNASLALEAAVHGQGVCISNLVLAGDLIATGRLVRPFAAVLPSDSSYFLVHRKGEQDSKVSVLRDFLVRNGNMG